ncbi:MAG: cation:proton antiporter [Actinobacteria bacterium]|nr:cation:proton antiporter [Actinomycetota bacterium]
MDTGSLLIELGAVALILSLVARLAGGIGISAIPLYVLAGLALGEGGLVPVITAEEFLEAGAEIGVILLLLMLGVEYSGRELIDGLRRTAPVAGLDLVLNAGAGFVFGLVLGFGHLGAIVLGGVTYASSSGIVAKLVDELGWLGNRETPGMLSLLVAEDLLMALYLPILGVLLLGGAGASLVGQVALAVTAAFLVLGVAIRFGGTISAWLFTEHTEAMLLGAFGLALLVAGAAEAIQVSAAVGAFMVGIAISGPAQEVSRALFRPLRDLFAALFFTFFSLTIDPGDIPPVLLTAVLLAVVTGATKYAVVRWGATRDGVGERGRNRAGLAMLARGEFSIVIAELGVASGIDERLGPLAAAYVLILAIAGPVLVRVSSAYQSRVK